MIPIARPVLGEAEMAAARSVLESEWLAQGPQVEAFETAFAELVGAPHACAVSSCTAALHLALKAVGVSTGDEVITVSYSFVAAANCIRLCGGEPVFVDIEGECFNLDPRQLEGAITRRTRAILCVHQMGMPCDLPAIIAIARAHGIPVIEDAACATGAEIRVDGSWERIGRPHGDIACFSFHPRKVITTGEGGMLTTANGQWDRQFRQGRQHGMDIPAAARHAAQAVVFESFPTEGFNYRMTDLQAAIGREQLRRLPDIIRRRREVAARYRTAFGTEPAVHLPTEPIWARTNWQSYCVRLPDHANQRDVMQRLRDRGIATRPGITCAHREVPYRDARRMPLPVSEAAQDRCVLLPLYAQMTAGEQDKVVDAVTEVCRP